MDTHDETVEFFPSTMFFLEVTCVYVGVCYNQEMGSLAILEPIRSSNNDEHILRSIVLRFTPESIVCNVAIKEKVAAIEGEFPRLVVKQWSDFKVKDGEKFIGKFINQLEDDEARANMLDTLYQLTVTDEYPLYVRFFHVLVNLTY